MNGETEKKILICTHLVLNYLRTTLRITKPRAYAHTFHPSHEISILLRPSSHIITTGSVIRDIIKLMLADVVNKLLLYSRWRLSTRALIVIAGNVILLNGCSLSLFF